MNKHSLNLDKQTSNPVTAYLNPKRQLSLYKVWRSITCGRELFDEHENYTSDTHQDNW